jgi:glycosyltransferase involved in cell wall biosynthesis
MATDLSVVIPVYNEGSSVEATLDPLFEVLGADSEVLVVYDMAEDTTAPVLERYVQREARLRPVLNTYGRGPAQAIRYGLDQARSPVSVVMMADSSDDPAQVRDLAALLQQGAVVAAASRYMKGGRQIGGPVIKRTLSRLAGLSLYYLGRVGTHDATNSFKAYSTPFVRTVGIESEQGFEIGIELVAKARRARLPVAEIPTTWTDRSEGESRFRVAAWIPHYLRWYLYALGPKRSLEEMGKRTSGVRL